MFAYDIQNIQQRRRGVLPRENFGNRGFLVSTLPSRINEHNLEKKHPALLYS